MSLKPSAFITSSASVLPNAAINNEQIEDILGLINNKPSRVKRIILKNNGIKMRYYALNPQTHQATMSNAQLSAQAIKKLFDDKTQLKKIDLITTGSTTPDQLAPGHSVMVHGQLKTPPCETASLSGICISGLMALKYAYLSVKNADSKKAVVVGSELVSPLLHASNFASESLASDAELIANPELAFDKDFLRWMLSDGAGALCIEPKPKPGAVNLKIEWIKTYSYAGELETCMYMGANKLDNGELLGWKQCKVLSSDTKNLFALKQDVKLLNLNIVKYAISETLGKLVRDTGIQADEVDYFLPHISSMYFLSKVKKALDDKDFIIPMEKWFTNLESKGNTGAAYIFIMLDELIKSKRLSSNDKVLCFVPESGRFSSGFMLLTVV